MNDVLGVDPKSLLLDKEAVANDVRRYYADAGNDSFTGRHFDQLGRTDGQVDDPDRFTAVDILAVAALSVNVPVEAAMILLQNQTFHSLLSEIPQTPLWQLESDALGGDSPANKLWSQLVELPGIKWVTAGKLIAHKRPATIPVYDRVIRGTLQTKGSFWLALRKAFDDHLVQSLTEIRAEAAVGTDIPLLRILDVALWMRFHEDY